MHGCNTEAECPAGPAALRSKAGWTVVASGWLALRARKKEKPGCKNPGERRLNCVYRCLFASLRTATPNFPPATAIKKSRTNAQMFP